MQGVEHRPLGLDEGRAYPLDTLSTKPSGDGASHMRRQAPVADAVDPQKGPETVVDLPDLGEDRVVSDFVHGSLAAETRGRHERLGEAVPICPRKSTKLAGRRDLPKSSEYRAVRQRGVDAPDRADDKSPEVNRSADERAKLALIGKRRVHGREQGNGGGDPLGVATRSRERQNMGVPRRSGEGPESSEDANVDVVDVRDDLGLRAPSGLGESAVQGRVVQRRLRRRCRPAEGSEVAGVTRSIQARDHLPRRMIPQEQGDVVQEAQTPDAGHFLAREAERRRAKFAGSDGERSVGGLALEIVGTDEPVEERRIGGLMRGKLEPPTLQLSCVIALFPRVSHMFSIVVLSTWRARRRRTLRQIPKNELEHLQTRNRLRREARLPTLDMTREIAHLIRDERRRRDAEARQQDAKRIRSIEDTVVAEYRARLGRQFGAGLFDRLAVHAEALRRWRRLGDDVEADEGR